MAKEKSFRNVNFIFMVLDLECFSEKVKKKLRVTAVYDYDDGIISSLVKEGSLWFHCQKA
jgi:hypothetical protein